MNDVQIVSRNYNTNGSNGNLEEMSLASKLRELSELSLDDSTDSEGSDNLTSHSNLQRRLEPIHEANSDVDSNDESYIQSYQDLDAHNKLLDELDMPNAYEVVNMMEDSNNSMIGAEKKIQQQQDYDEEETANSPTGTTSQQMSMNYINKIFQVKNIDSGDVFDVRTEDGFQKEKNDNDKIPASSDLRLQGLPWKAYWKKVRQNNELLWDYSEEGDAERVRSLITNSRKESYPAQIDSRLLDNMTAMHLAAGGGHVEVIRTLLSFGADKEAKTKMGRTPLHVAVLQGRLEAVEILIAIGADINATDKEFSTPLHYASEHGFINIIEELLSAGPKVTAKNHAGLTAIDVALNSETWKVFQHWNLANEKMLCSFGRICVDNFLIYNSRADYVSRILLTHNKMYRQNHGIPPKLVCGTDDKGTYKKHKRKGSSRFKSVILKMNDHCSSWKNNPTPESFDDSSVVEATEKVGPKSFICHTMLGKGSFGEVYLVEKISNNRVYAMKVLRKDKIVSQNLTRYAKTERNVLSLMNHPFIVRLNYAFQTDTKLYLLLDYCPGGDLGSMLTRKKRLTEELARIYAAEVTLALEELHKCHIIFRDLKPDNVVIDADGHARLTDFGLSKEGVNDNISKSFCGSVAYLAPEMLRRSGHNRTVDWYLLGVLLYEMLVGVPPYFSSNREELFENIQKAQLKLPRSMSEEAKHLIKSLLNRNPARRLGAENDALDIKSHPWFKSINWDHASQRKLKPPKPLAKSINREEPTSKVVDDTPETTETSVTRDYIPNWSFIVPDEQQETN